MGALRIAIDGTPLLGHRTGVGEVTAGLVRALAERDDVAITTYALTWRGRHSLAGQVPDNATVATRPIPATVVRELWGRGATRPRAEDWTGPVDVVHATNFVAPPAHAPVVVTVHDLTFLRFPELCTPDTLRYPTLLERAIARGATVHTPSEFVATEVRELLGAPADRVIAIHSGIPTVPPGNAAAGARIAGGSRYVLALGTIEPRKNLPTLVTAFSEVARTDHALRLVLAGPAGWDSQRVQESIDASRAGSRVVQLGYVGDEQRADLLAGALAFAYPSIYEGFGFPPLEAMQSGVPVIAGDAGALPEVLGDAAWFITPKDVDALIEALTALTSSDAGNTARTSFIERGNQRVKQYSWTTTAERMVDLYRTCR